MKRMKKIASLALALIMALAMTTTAFAADNNPHKITVTQNADDTTSHTYEAYQIFAGDLATVDGQEVLSNIIWGSGVNPANLLTALKTEEEFNGAFAECKSAADVAAVLADENKFQSSDGSTTTATDIFARLVEKNLTTPAGEATGSGDVTIDVIGSGYYLIKDKDGTVDSEGAYSRFMLEVVANASATVKSEVPHGDKQIYVDSTQTDDANNASIGSHVSYVITSEVPNWRGYKYYYFIMNDTLSTGLTFDGEGTVNVKVGNAELVKDVDYYVYTEGVDPYTFRLAFADIMKYPVGSQIAVTYSATVNGNAVIGTTGNPNTWKLEYSNNPGETFEKDKDDDENKPGIPSEESGIVLGETPEEKTLTYVTQLDITKYANSVAEDHLLAGAEFTLTGTSKQVVLKAVDYYDKADNGTYYLLKDGTYTTTPPTGTSYVEIGVGTATTTTGYLKNADGTYYVPSDVNEYKGKTLYKLVKGTADNYLDVNTKYVKKTAENITYEDADVSIEMTTGADGKISFERLGAGTYTLTETVTPKGYNTLEPINITITFTPPTEEVTTGNEKCSWTMTASNGLTITQNEDTSGNGLGVFAADVINNKGSLLPSTGGIGTTIFYVTGGILVLAAVVLLVTKKRMSAEK